MSGPKTSRYTLTAEQRRIIMERRRIQLETELLQKKIAEVHNNISRRVSLLDSQLEEMEFVLKEVGEDFGLLNNLKNLRNQVMEIAIESNSVVKQTNLETLRKVSSKLQQAYKSLQDESNRVFSIYSKREKEFRQNIEETIDDGFEVSFYDLDIQQEKPNRGYRAKVEDALEKIAVLYLSDDLQNKYEQIKNKVSEIDNVDFLNNYYTVTICPFVKECLEVDEFYRQMGEVFESLKETYLLLCEKVSIFAEDVPFSYSGVEILKNRVSELEAQVLQQEEEVYISECIDETMREMGYDLIGEKHIQKKNGSRFTKELYLFEEGTAVNITYASNGQITMELGGIDDLDRIPTKEESKQLTQNMRSFCDDYYQIEKCLRKKGVITKRISILPAEEEFTQIINVSDYEMNKEVSSFEVRSSKHKNMKNKVLHREV